MKRIKLTLVAMLSLGLVVGCGSSTSASNKTADNMGQRFSYLNQGFVTTGGSTVACIQAGTGNSYKIRTVFDHTLDPEGTLSVISEEYRKSDCSGTPERTIRQEYVYFIGEEMDQGTRLQLDLLLAKYDYRDQDIRDFAEGVLFGTNIIVGDLFHTVVVGEGGIQTDTLKYGFGNADVNHDGVTSDFRAQNVDKYTQANTFLLQN